MWRAQHFPTLATCKYGKDDNNLTCERCERVKPKTFLHENFLWPINYAHRVCPNFLTAAIEGLAATAFCMFILLALFMLFSVCSGVSKQLSKGERISSDRARSTAARSFDVFPSASANYREIIRLRAAVARLEAIVGERWPGTVGTVAGTVAIVGDGSAGTVSVEGHGSGGTVEVSQDEQQPSVSSLCFPTHSKSKSISSWTTRGPLRGNLDNS